MINWESKYISRWGVELYTSYNSTHIYEIEKDGDFGITLRIFTIDGSVNHKEYKFRDIDMAKNFANRLIRIDSIIK